MLRKKVFVLILAAFLVSAISGIARANTYDFSPSVSGLWDLTHQQYYKWGVNWSLPTGEHITSASLTYKQIWDWAHETDHLYTHLLDSVTPGITVGNDLDGSSDYFNGQGLLLGNWSDPYGDSLHKIDLTYDIPSTHFSWLSDGNFGFGIDPDCHYYNDGIVFTINTSTVPEPATLSLLGLGLLGILGLRKKRS